MVDVNKIVRDILESIGGVKVTFYHPGQFNKLPVISYYELTSNVGLCYDNAEQAQKSSIAVDIWGKSGAECAHIAVKADEAMQNHGWQREFSRDLPPENGIYHKSMRFYKQIYF